MVIAGIDPGLHGCVARIEPHNDNAVGFMDTPLIEVRKGNKIKFEYDIAGMVRLLRCLAPTNTHVFIEKVGAMPGQGVTSMFNFGKGFGIWLGILGALGLPYTLVTPQAWKKVLMEGERDKDASRLVAQRLYPTTAENLNRKKDVGRADALLIAEYGRRKLNGNG